MLKSIATFFSFLVISFLSFSQTEKDQKLTIKNQPNSPVYYKSNESYEKSLIRQENSRPQYQKFQQPIIYNDYPMWNRWNRWGAPMYGYNYYDTWYTNDLYGRRLPVRTYYYRNGNSDTIYGNPMSTRFGIHYTNQKDFGGWITIGSKNFFYFELNTKIETDNSTFYDDYRVNFVQALQVWKDERKKDLNKGSSVYAGFGTKIKRSQFYLAIGHTKEKKHYQFFDETFSLSNNGLYSFSNTSKNIISFKVGIIQDWKRFSFKTDYDPIRNNFAIGFGLNF